MDLTVKHCVPCEGGTKPFGQEEIGQYVSALSLPWEVVDGKKLRYQFKFKDFSAAMKFVNQIADTAQAEDHHPDLHIYYNKVTVELTTHAIGGLSINDFILAAKTEALSH